MNSELLIKILDDIQLLFNNDKKLNYSFLKIILNFHSKFYKPYFEIIFENYKIKKYKNNKLLIYFYIEDKEYKMFINEDYIYKINDNYIKDILIQYDFYIDEVAPFYVYELCKKYIKNCEFNV